MADEARYHVRFEDGASGESLGLMLTESPQIGFTRRLINPYAAKMSSGASQDSDLTEWSVISWRDWRGGRGQEDLEDGSAFYDSRNVESRIENQLTLGPLEIQPTGTYPKYEPGDVGRYVVAHPAAVEYSGFGGSWLGSDFLVGGTYTKVGERFLVRDVGGDATQYVKSVDVKLRKLSASSAVRVSIYSSGSDGLPDAELCYKEVAAGSVGTSYAWVNFEFSSVQAVSTGAYYWVVVTVTAGDEYLVQVSRYGYFLYGDGYMATYSGSWSEESTYDIFFRVRYERVAMAMSFTCPDGGITCTSVQLYLGRQGYPGNFTVGLHTDDGGDPASSAMTSKTLSVNSDVGTTMGWVQVEWASGQTLTGGSTYHIVITPPTTEYIGGPHLVWGGKSTGGYATGAAHYKIGSGSWTSMTPDLYFRVNTDVLDSTVVAFAQFDSAWYCAAGDTVYKWTDGDWVSNDQQSGYDVTALVAWGDYLWAARGSAPVLRRYDGESWENTEVYANLLCAGGGYLHRTNGTSGHRHEVFYTADGDTWSESAISVGTGAQPVTGMAWYRDMLVCATAVRLWGVAADLPYPLLDWHSQEDSDNGKGMLAWSKTGCLYIPLRFGLYRWNGDTMVAMGPEQGMGLPAARAGKIAALCGTGNWLFAAVDAGTSGYSSIMAYSGRGGWHELQRAERTGQRIKALQYETLNSPNRLWFGLSDETRYLQLPDYSDNPWQWTGYEFNATGELDMSWIGGDLLEVVKDWHQVVVRAEGLSAGSQWIDVHYEVDRSGRWTHLGRVEDGPRQALDFAASDFTALTIGAASTRTTIELASGSTTTELEPGDWCRINNEVRQIDGVTDSNTFTLETALSAVPVPGDVVYGSRPAGRELRLRLVLSTTDRTTTPKVKAVFLRFQNNVLDRFVFQLNVRVADGMKDLAGNPYPWSAEDLRAELDDWARRTTTFALVDPDGQTWTVKAISVGEGGYAREEGALPTRYSSVYSMNLVEVG